jgi:hypothetical protein
MTSATWARTVEAMIMRTERLAQPPRMENGTKWFGGSHSMSGE